MDRIRRNEASNDGTGGLYGGRKKRREEEKKQPAAPLVVKPARVVETEHPAAETGKDRTVPEPKAARTWSRGIGGHSMGAAQPNRPSEAKGLFERAADQQLRAVRADAEVRRAETEQVKKAAGGLYRAYAEQRERAVRADTEVRRAETEQVKKAAGGLYRAYAEQREAVRKQNEALAVGTSADPLAAAAGTITPERQQKPYSAFIEQKDRKGRKKEDKRKGATASFGLDYAESYGNGQELYRIRHEQQERESKRFRSSLADLLGIGLRMSSSGNLSDSEREHLYQAQRDSGRQLLESIAASRDLAIPNDWEGRQELIDEYRSLRSLVNPFGIESEDDARRMDRMMEIRGLLERNDIAAGNGLRNYDYRDRAGTVIVGTSKKTAGSIVHAAGELGRNIGKNLTLSQLGGLEQEMMDRRLGIDHEALVKEAREDIDSEAAKRPWQKMLSFAAQLTDSAEKDLTQAKEGLDALGIAGVDMAENLIEMGFDRVTGCVLGNSLIPMFLRTLGSAAQEAQRNGATEEEEYLYGITKAGIEIATEKLFDGVANIYGEGAADEIIEKLVQRLAESDTGRTFLRTIINSAGEGTEEVISDLLSPLAEMIYRDETVGELYAQIDPSEVLYDYFIGASVGMLGGGIGFLSGQDAQANELLALVDAAEVDSSLDRVFTEADEAERNIESSKRRIRQMYLSSPDLSRMMLEGNTDKIEINGFANIQKHDKIGLLPNGRTIESTRPLYSPVLKKWIAHGGEVSVRIDGENVTWIFTSAEGDTVSYVNGMIQFGEEHFHPLVRDIDISTFTDRASDKKAVRMMLKNKYGFDEIPKGYAVHHDVINGSIQLVQRETHKKFTHFGGIYLYTK